jgi:hypothetical protein
MLQILPSQISIPRSDATPLCDLRIKARSLSLKLSKHQPDQSIMGASEERALCRQLRGLI